MNYQMMPLPPLNGAEVAKKTPVMSEKSTAR